MASRINVSDWLKIEEAALEYIDGSCYSVLDE